jgi:hypothetical protein
MMTFGNCLSRKMPDGILTTCSQIHSPTLPTCAQIDGSTPPPPHPLEGIQMKVVPADCARLQCFMEIVIVLQTFVLPLIKLPDTLPRTVSRIFSSLHIH